MPRIIAKPDTLNDINGNYQHAPLVKPVFLNSVPKCGTHLIRNIFRMFVPVAQQYHETFVQLPNLREHIQVFNPLQPKLSWGHLLFSDESVMALHDAEHIVVVRDPYDWVLARARFFLSDTFQGNMENLKSGRVTIEEVLNMMIFGIYQKAPTLNEIFTHNGVSWLGTGAKLVRYEDIIAHLKQLDSDAAESYFAELLAPVLAGRGLPDDWRERVLLGSDREQSGTYRDNLQNLALEVPNELPEQQKQLVDFAAPGLRRVLGYEK